MRLRELTSREEGKESTDEVAILSWALADLIDCSDESTKLKLQSEPLMSQLQDCYGGAASYAHQRIVKSCDGYGT